MRRKPKRRHRHKHRNLARTAAASPPPPPAPQVEVVSVQASQSGGLLISFSDDIATDSGNYAGIRVFFPEGNPHFVDSLNEPPEGNPSIDFLMVAYTVDGTEEFEIDNFNFLTFMGGGAPPAGIAGFMPWP